MTEADRNLRALINSAGVVVLAFQPAMEAGTLDARQRMALQILEEVVRLFNPPLPENDARSFTITLGKITSGKIA